MFGDNAQLFLGFLLGLGGIIFAVAYAYGQIRTGTTKALQESNTTLRQLIDDQNSKIAVLETSHQENKTQIASLQGKVDTLLKTNGDLSNMIQLALNHYFENHPDKAMELAAELSNQKR